MIIKLVQKSATKTSRGMLSKAWYLIDERLCLVKGNSIDVNGHIGYEPYSEVMASNIANALNLEHIPYTIMNASLFPDVKVFSLDVVSVCEQHLPEGYIRVPFYHYIVAKLGDEPEDYVEAYKKFLDPDPLYKMLAFDALIGNEDRHLHNFDILVSRDHEKLSPLYDQGTSLLSWVPNAQLSLAKEMGRIDKSKPFRSKHSTQIKLVPKGTLLIHDFDALYDKLISSIESTLSLLPMNRSNAIRHYLKWRMKYIQSVMG